MFCPVCGQQQINADVRFCSRCGFPLAEVSRLIAGGGASQELIKSPPVKMSERRRGIKQGAALLLSGIILVPLVGIITAALNAPPFAVALTALATFIGGIVRMIYALLFEAGDVEAVHESLIPAFISEKMSSGNKKNKLPPADITDKPDYESPATLNRNTNELIYPPSVTDETTRLLKRGK